MRWSVFPIRLSCFTTQEALIILQTKQAYIRLQTKAGVHCVTQQAPIMCLHKQAFIDLQARAFIHLHKKIRRPLALKQEHRHYYIFESGRRPPSNYTQNHTYERSKIK